MFGHVACRLVVGPEVAQGRGDGGNGGVFVRGGRPSSGEAADGYGAAAAERPGPAFGPVATASVTPHFPPHWASRARVGDPRHPAPTSPNTVPSLTPQPERTRSCLR